MKLYDKVRIIEDGRTGHIVSVRNNKMEGYFFEVSIDGGGISLKTFGELELIVPAPARSKRQKPELSPALFPEYLK